MHFAEWIALKRKAQRMSMADCAKIAGVSTPVWHEYENLEKRAQPRQNTVKKIALALGVSEEEALQAAGYDTGAKTELPPEVYAYFRMVPREKHASLTEIIGTAAKALSG